MELQSSFKFMAVVDGATLNGYLRVDGSPLVQRYRPGTEIFIPDFPTLPDNNKPTVATVIMNVSDGTVLVPNTLTFKYNGVELTFGSDGLSTNAGWEGTFKRITGHPINIGGQSYPMTVLRIMKNLASASNVDNDRISVSGTVEIGGSSIEFNELSIEVSIMESTDNIYDIILEDDNGGHLVDGDTSTTIKAKIYQSGMLLEDTTGFSYKWFKVEASGDAALGTAATQVITVNDVDSVLTVRCDVYKDSSLLASGFLDIADITDPYYIQLNITGVTGDYIRKGETAVVTPVAVKRSTGEINPDLVTSWQFRTVNNEGEDFKLQNHPSASFTGANCQITYTDTVNGGGAIIGYIGGNY